MYGERVAQGWGFLDAVRYITHDPRSQSADRVGLMGTRNTLSDDAERAAWEMYFTWAEAPLTKQVLGYANGRKPKHGPVSHFVISFSPKDTDKLTPELYEAAVDGLLKCYGLEGNQAVWAEHTDKEHRHLHIVANRVDWETGKLVNVKDDHNKLSRWQQAFEKENGLENVKTREDNNKRRDDGERVVGEYEEKNLKKGIAPEPEAIREEQRGSGDTHGPAPEAKPDRVTYAEMRQHQREDWDNLSAAHKAQWSALFMRQNAERAAQFKDQREAYLQRVAEVKREAQAAWNDAKAQFKPQWREYFKEKKEREREFNEMGPLARAVYYMRNFDEISPDKRAGVLSAFFNAKETATELRRVMEQKNEEARQRVTEPQTAAARSAADGVWSQNRGDLARVKMQQAAARQQTRDIHEQQRAAMAGSLKQEREALKTAHADERDALKQWQKDRAGTDRGDRSAAGLAPQGMDAGRYVRPQDRPAPAQARQKPAQQRQQVERPTTRPAAPQARQQAVPAVPTPPAPSPVQAPPAAAKNAHLETFAKAAVETQRPTAEQREDMRTRKILDEAKARQQVQERTESEAKTRAGNGPAWAAYTLADNFRQQAEKMKSRAVKEREEKKQGKDKGRGMDRERER